VNFLMHRSLLKPIGAFIALAMSAGVCSSREGKLTATVADVQGKCLRDNMWTPVAGRYIYWQIDGPQIAGRWHESNLIEPERASMEGFPGDSTALRRPFAFSINLTAMSTTLSSFVDAFPELTFRDAMRKKLNKPNLVAATMVHRVKEADLFRLNLTNTKNPFRKDDWEGEYYVPTQYSVCDLDIKYLMNRAEAIFEKQLLGKTLIKSDQTIPLKQGQQTFAETLLSR
jgi:hypothetical protein